jgi:serine/threonine-protein kinase
MALESGSTLGHYEIVSSLGAGGMGEVYRAKDTKLGREVAVKLLLEEVSADPERMARFEREARMLASLNHGNIATLHGFEKDGDTRFLVMELVEGETLADRIARGPVPVEETIALFLQIAEGLEAAHEKGVIHRDLKPANVKLSAKGEVKVLDFGLAKAMTPAGEETDPGSISESPTMTLAATMRGEVLGTAAYMAPEQAEGREVDTRADLWAFGACLYEALTGARTFDGDRPSMVLAAVLKDDPDWSVLPTDTPRGVRRVLERTLQKDPTRRARHIGDLRLDLEEAQRPDDRPGKERADQPSGARLRTPTALAALLGVGLLGAAIAWIAKPAPESPSNGVTRLPLAWDTEIDTRMLGLTFGVLSPDGSTFVYPAEGQLFARRFDQVEPIPLRGTENGVSPFFSPDGRSVGFFTSRELRRVPVGGGVSEKICDVSFGLTGDWGPDETVIFGTWGPSGLWRVAASGGTPEVLTEVAGDEFDHDYADFIPGGDAIVFSVAPAGYFWDEGSVVLQSLETGERKVLLEDAFYPRYSPTGHLLFARRGALFAVPFDASAGEIAGEAIPVVDTLMQSRYMSGIAQYSISDTGTLAYVSGSDLVQPTVAVWVDRRGQETPLGMEAARYFTPSLSPDGRSLAAEIRDSEDTGLWVFDLDGSDSTRLTFDRSGASAPIWRGDEELIYVSGATGDRRVFTKRADGAGTASEIVGSDLWPWDVTPDGSTLLGHAYRSETEFDIFTVDLGGDGSLTTLIGTGAREIHPRLSPDGRWLAYQSDESQRMEVYVRPYPDIEGGRWQVSDGGGTMPEWRSDGRELFYRDGRRVLAVTIEAGESLETGAPEILFEGLYTNTPLSSDFLVAPDGSRFLMFKTLNPPESHGELILVQNWFEDLESLVSID